MNKKDAFDIIRNEIWRVSGGQYKKINLNNTLEELAIDILDRADMFYHNYDDIDPDVCYELNKFVSQNKTITIGEIVDYILKLTQEEKSSFDETIEQKNVDWEQRKWELVCHISQGLLAGNSSWSPQEAVQCAEEIISAYRGQMQTNTQ